MIEKKVAFLGLVMLSLTLASCYHPYGYNFYPGAPRLAATNPANVELFRREPRRDSVRLGEVWISPDPYMSRAYVEGILREKAALMGADAVVIVVDKVYHEGTVYSYWRGPVRTYERHIVGVAIRFRR